jgi:sigma-B regulation protein RsbU (phosphoserine phosphatase)
MSSVHDLQEKNRLLQQAYDELKAAQAQIIEKERLERELQVAAQIQISILPQELPHTAQVDFGARMVPARMVGGDFYDVFTLSGERFGVVVGDVADKGVPSAIFMARTHALIAAETAHGGTAGDILRRVNAHLIKLEQAELFVTVLFGILDGQKHEFAYARAGHESPLLLTADGMVEVPARAPGQPVGMFDGLLLDERAISLPAGSTLLLFTDGMTDGRNPAGEPFGRERLQATLAGLAGRPAQAVCDSLLEALKAHQAAASQDDDVTLLAVHSIK